MGTHRHGAGALLVGLEQSFVLHVDGMRRACQRALVPAEAAHSLECGGRHMAVLYLFAHAGEYRYLDELCGARGRAIVDAPAPSGLASTLHAFFERPPALEERRKLEDCLAAPAPRWDARVARALELMDDTPSALPLRSVARRVALSESRLQHRFARPRASPRAAIESGNACAV